MNRKFTASTWRHIDEPPVGLVTFPESNVRIDLEWTLPFTSMNPKGVSVERSIDGATGWVVIATLEPGSTGYEDTTLNTSETRFYRVREFNDNGPGPYSFIESGTTFTEGQTANLSTADFTTISEDSSAVVHTIASGISSSDVASISSAELVFAIINPVSDAEMVSLTEAGSAGVTGAGANISDSENWKVQDFPRRISINSATPVSADSLTIQEGASAIITGGDANIVAADALSFVDALKTLTAHFSDAQLFSFADQGQVGGGISPPPPGAHPRLLVTQADVATMRTWATAGNPWWTDIQQVLVPQVKAKIAAGTIPQGDTGVGGLGSYAVENYSIILAFASLMEPDPVVAADNAQKAHDLVMYAFNIAKQGDLVTNPRAAFRDPDFMTGDRMRWSGIGFPLTVDWCYQTFTTQEKLDIRECFTRWANNCRTRGFAEAAYPTPIGTLADPVLYNTSDKRRWSANNYYQARSMITGLMANALDPADDPSNLLIGPYNDIFWKAWVYVRDHAEDTDYPGGISPEGMEYGVNGFGTLAMTVEALNHAGVADPVKYGTAVNLLAKSHWQNYTAATVSQLSPNKAVRIPNSLGPVYYPAEYGDTRTYQTVDPIMALFAVGRYNAEHGLGTAALDAARWICYNMRDFAPSQWRKIQRDTYGAGNPLFVIIHYLMFDPTSPTQYGSADPRPSYPLDCVSPGLTRILSRTDWGDNATWIIMHAPWNLINHQMTQCGKVEMYRKGEWLTCTRAGYGVYHDASDNGNSLSLQSPYRSNLQYPYMADGQHGSQWLEVSDTHDPINVYSLQPAYIYLQSDFGNLYRSTYASSTDVTQANRSIMWLRGDYILVYDRAKSVSANQWKREEWSTVTLATISGNVATATNASGQHLYITSVLPAGATLTAYDPKDPAFTYPGDTIGLQGEQEDGTPMHYRVRIEDATNPTVMRWLTVLQGADSGTAATVPGTFASSAGTPFDGVTINPGSGIIAVLFIQDPSVAFAGMTFTIPTGAVKVYVTGLAVSSGYTVTNVAGVVTIAASGSSMTDSGGVLTINP